MCLHLLTILTSQGHISKLSVISETAKCTVDILLEVIPLKTEFFRHLLLMDVMGWDILWVLVSPPLYCLVWIGLASDGAGL